MAAVDRIRELQRRVQRDAVRRWQDRSRDRTANEQAVAVGGPGAADSAARNLRYRQRKAVLVAAESLRERNQLPAFLERKIGPTLDYLAFAPSEAARKAGRAVARIVDSLREGVQPEGFATGFLVSPNLLLTNWHVFPREGDAVGCGANFLYEKDEHGQQVGLTFAISPEKFYVANQTLDYAVVYVEAIALTGQRLSDLGLIALIEATPKILIGQPVNIIEYPEGGAKEYATTNNRLVDILDNGFLHYETDTLEGSSGSPAFSEDWELVGLHHASIPEMRGEDIIAVDGSVWNESMGDDQIHWIANEGIRASAIVASLRGISLADPSKAKLLTGLIASTTDPVDEIAAQTGLLTPESITHPATPLILNSGSASSAMPNNQFIFSGPVTIHIHTAAAPESTIALATTPAPVPASEASIRFDTEYGNREGFDELFLAQDNEPEMRVPKPGVSAERQNEMLGRFLDYHHFTIAFNVRRRLQLWSAVNVDYDSEKKGGSRGSFGKDKWITDPRLSANLQITDNDFYGPAGQVDRGHIVRREDNAWGDSDLEREFANSDTFHFTNCTPQHQAFNRTNPNDPRHNFGSIKGLWGGFEDFIQGQLQKGDTKACILAGPVLSGDDPVVDFGTGPIAYPIKFWKVVVVAERSGSRHVLKAYGFVLSQKDVVDKFGIEFLPSEKFKRLQTSLSDITELTGVTFDQVLHDADQAAHG